MFCFKCKSKTESTNNKIGFRAVCEKCGSDLHVCKNCKNYCPGKPNDCLIPNTLYVEDREKFNFCKDFSPKEEMKNSKIFHKDDVAKRLFKDNDNGDDSPSSFDSLFKK